MTEAVLSATDPVHDEELVSRFVSGDERAFSRLVDRYQEPVFRFLYRMIGGDWTLAEELTQETFVRAFRGAAGFKGSYRFSTWLFTIAKNCARKRWKQSKRRPDSPAGGASDSTGDPPAGPRAPSPGDVVEKRELAAFVQKAVGLLDPNHRLALVLTYYEGRSYEEASEILGRPRGTVKSWVFRAKRELAKTLADWKVV